MDALGNTSITANDIDNGSNDACGIDSLFVSPAAFTCLDVGANMVTLTVTDNNGNVSTCTAMVTVEDSVPPIALCQNVTVQLDAGGNAGITAADVNNGSNDACGIASLSVSPNAFTCSNMGANVVVLTVTDLNNNVSTCTGMVTVLDTVPPVAVCQNITIQLAASGNAAIAAADVNGGSNDACGIDSVAVSPASFNCSNIGANTVTLTVFDNNSNVSTCSATVTVEDTVPPVALCQGVTVQLDAVGNASITASDVDGGSNDACGIDSLAVSPQQFTCVAVGANTVVLTVTDNNGNTANCTATVVVEDTVPPMALCQNFTVQLNASGNAAIIATDVDGGSNDACGIDSLAISPSTFTCSNIGANAVILTATDLNGNTATCTATVTVEDTVPPVAICQSITLQLDATGNASIAALDVDGGSNDACGIDSLFVTPSSFDCSNVGTNNVTLVVTDNNGNVATCVAIVTVEDTVPPQAICQNITLQLDASGNASMVAADVDGGSIDACGIDSLAVSPRTFTCVEAGPNTVSLTVWDNHGNQASCTAVVTVADTVAPIALCQPITVQLNAAGNGFANAIFVDAGSNDACGIDTLVLSRSNFTCADIGPNTVTLVATDQNGNIDACSTTIMVVDTVAPVALCQSISVQLNAAGIANVAALAIDNGSNDACGIDSLGLSPATFTCANVGVNSVMLSATDNNGNVSTCTASVTVGDTVPPMAVCQNLTVQLNGAGTAGILANDLDGGSSDACGVAAFAASRTSFTCADVGPNNVTLLVTDLSSNADSCVAVVTVADTVPPMAVCQSITIQLDTAGTTSILASDLDGGSGDACGIAFVTASATMFTCANIGLNVVTLTVTDVNGNVSNCSAAVNANAAPLSAILSSPLLGCGYNVACNGDSSGSVTALPLGGCPTYTYAWSNGGNTATISGVPAGTYTVTITDGFSALVVDSITLTEPVPIQNTAQISSWVCNGDSTGMIDLSTVGGHDCAPYTYLWSNGDTTQDIFNLIAGTYTVTVTDTMGCVRVDNITLNLQPLPAVNLGPDVQKCAGDSALLTPGNTFANYLWNTGAITPSILAAQVGTYWVEVIDVFGCVNRDTIVVSDYVLQTSIITPLGGTTLCGGDSLELMGDAGMQSYLWSTGDTTQNTVVVDTGGTYFLMAVNANGCQIQDSIVLVYAPFLDPRPVIVPGPLTSLCEGMRDTLDAGPGYFAYLWNTGATTRKIIVSDSGRFVVTVSNVMGCTAVSDTVTVSRAVISIPTISLVGGTLYSDQVWLTYQWYRDGML
ncbi:MAG TPA: HYR domain-containing protein, partial [Bacteroidetes bacterium]|nr:HYR domain-containing protein [Bacteroidota bacterium]